MFGDTENEIIKLSSTIEEAHASVSEKIEAEVTQTSEAMAQIREHVVHKFRDVSGDMQQVRRNADGITNVNAALGELQNKVASGNSSTPQ